MTTATTVTQKNEEVKKVRRNSAIPPYYLLKNGNKFFIEEESKPFVSRDECKLKISELKTNNEFETYRLHKHCGRYFIYRKNK